MTSFVALRVSSSPGFFRSGEELFCNHEHFDSNDPDFERTEVFRFDRDGGFLLRPGWKAEVASVSQVRAHGCWWRGVRAL